MCLRKICGRKNVKAHTCCRCNAPLHTPLHDYDITTCEHCGQQHFTDVYNKIVSITVVEHPELRHRNLNARDVSIIMTRRNLIRRSKERHGK